MSAIDNIVAGQTITWPYLIDSCLEAIKAISCNIGSYKGVPTRLQSANAGEYTVKGITTGIPNSQSTQTFNYKTKGTNAISIVQESTVNSELSTFLSAAGINTRSNKVCQAKEVSLVIALFTQFMAYHLKPVYSTRQAYNTAETQSLFQGIKYVTGTVTPNYTLTAIEPDNIPVVTDTDIQNIVNNSFKTNQLLSHYENPVNYKDQLY